MNKKEKRFNTILEMLTDEHKIEVTELSDKLGVSQVTIRKDLDELEQKGIITREHGYAILSNTDDLRTRIAYHYEDKKRIAAAAAELVSEGETIMIENGSCCALLADALSQKLKNLTIITNSAFIASYIRDNGSFRIVLLGGIYQPDSQVMIGPMVAECAKNFCVDKFFIGTDGYSLRSGFTNKDQMRAQAVRDMAKQANQVIVLTESSKFGHIGVVAMNLGEQLKKVITDVNVPEDCRNQLCSDGVEIIMAK